MVRTLSCLALILSLGLIGAAADNKTAADKNNTADKNAHKHDAKITKVDAKKGEVTVKMKDENGKETEKTFKLAEDIRYVDSTGRVAAIDVFQSGNEVLIVEADGKIKEMKKKGTADTNRNPK
jgi:uncharacterized lipoprotein NlpE involved in copper resistance